MIQTCPKSGTCPHWSSMNMIVLRCSKHNTHTHSEVSVLFCSHFWVRLAKPSGSNSASRTDTVFSARPTVKCFMDVSMPSVLRGHWQIKVSPIPLVLDFGEISPEMMNICWDSDFFLETYETSGEPSVHGLLLELMWWQSAKTFGFQLDDAALRGSNGLHLSGWSH